MENTVRQAYLLVTTTGEEAALPIHVFDGTDAGQVQVGGRNRDWVLHLAGTPASWRHLAKVIEDAAMDLERQIAEQSHADTDPGEHYAEQAAELGGAVTMHRERYSDDLCECVCRKNHPENMPVCHGAAGDMPVCEPCRIANGLAQLRPPSTPTGAPQVATGMRCNVAWAHDGSCGAADCMFDEVFGTAEVDR